MPVFFPVQRLIFKPSPDKPGTMNLLVLAGYIHGSDALISFCGVN
jgi:hypothetical protein